MTHMRQVKPTYLEGSRVQSNQNFSQKEYTLLKVLHGVGRPANGQCSKCCDFHNQLRLPATSLDALTLLASLGFSIGYSLCHLEDLKDRESQFPS